jgi:hypothetical protein
MSYSKLMRAALAVCAAWWLAASGLASGASRLLQGESPVPNPADSPIPPPFDSPIVPPVPDPAQCTVVEPCVETPTPAGEFQTFLPGLSESGGDVEAQPPGPPPDLGTILNYVAGAVVVIGVTLKVYWFISDRRKAAADGQRIDDSTNQRIDESANQRINE